MNNLQDLSIEKEILPLFDYSLNKITQQQILNLLKQPLQEKSEIIDRQNILKGFIKNYAVLKEYSYSFLYFNEVYAYLNNEVIEDLSTQKLKYKLLVSKRDKTQLANKINQVILLFHKLETNYFSKIALDSFPTEYQKSIQRINTFLTKFDLNSLGILAKKNKLKDNHIINFTRTIKKLKLKKEVLLFWEDLFLFETYLSLSIGIVNHNFSFPEFTGKGIELLEFHHPLIKNPIKNNFNSQSNVIVLNGANMSGKSTFLKAVSLCVYFGHLGLAIPASKGKIPFFNHFSIEINSKDNIDSGYSHFMTEVMSLKSVIENAKSGTKCFAVFDELFNGTNVEDAFEICKTTINGLSKFNNSLFFISTHIQELKNVTNASICNYYIDCELINNQPTFTYKLKQGWSNIKVGRILFEKEGLNKLLE